jgi:hypothetical protein
MATGQRPHWTRFLEDLDIDQDLDDPDLPPPVPEDPSPHPSRCCLLCGERTPARFCPRCSAATLPERSGRPAPPRAAADSSVLRDISTAPGSASA